MQICNGGQGRSEQLHNQGQCRSIRKLLSEVDIMKLHLIFGSCFEKFNYLYGDTHICTYITARKKYPVFVYSILLLYYYISCLPYIKNIILFLITYIKAVSSIPVKTHLKGHTPTKRKVLISSVKDYELNWYECMLHGELLSILSSSGSTSLSITH